MTNLLARGKADDRLLVVLPATAIATLIGGIAMFLGTWYARPEFAEYMTQEDGVVETATMAFFVLTLIVCLWAAWQSRSTLRYYLLLWALMSLVFAGEEVSWGQRSRLTLTLGRLDNLNGATFVQTGMMPW